MDMPIILFVDDEPNILKTLKRLFFDEEYEVYTAESGKHALELIDGGLMPTVIVSDQRMPGMTGAEFLAKARELVPDSIRMVLTGYADVSVAVDAINLGGVYRYIVKPWNDDDLKLSVADGINRYNLVNENRKLTLELQEANHNLANLNKELDAQVKVRTIELSQKVKELQGRDGIQQLLMTVQPLPFLLNSVLEVILNVSTAAGGAFLLLEAGSDSDFKLNCELSFYDSDFAAQKMNVEVLAAECMSADNGKGAIVGDIISRFDLSFLPLVKGKTKYGVLVVKSLPDKVFSEVERSTFMGFAGQAVMAISDSKVHDNLDDIGSSLDDVLNDLNIDSGNT